MRVCGNLYSVGHGYQTKLSISCRALHVDAAHWLKRDSKPNRNQLTTLFGSRDARGIGMSNWLRICSNHLWVPCLIHIRTLVETRWYTRATEYKDQTSVLYSSSSSRVNSFCSIRFFVAHSPLANCLLFSSLFVKIKFVSILARFNYSLWW